MLQTKRSTLQELSYYSELAQVLDEIEDLVQKANLNLHVFSDRPEEVRDFFQDLPQEHQASTVQYLRFFRDSCIDSIANTRELRDSSKLLWFFIQRFKLIPTPNLFDHIDSTDIVEIYDSSGVQVFRSFKIFDISTYGLEDVVVFPWFQLFERDPQITQGLMAQAQEVMTGDSSKVFKNKINQPHLVKETKSFYQKSATMEFKSLAALNKLGTNERFFLSTLIAREIQYQ